MSEDREQATIVGGDAVDVQVASDPDESRTIVTGLTVSASEKVSTGDYENYEPFQQVRLAFDPAIDASTPEGRADVRERAAQAHHDVQKDIEQAVSNRLADPDFEDWPDAVADGGQTDD